MQTQMRDRTRDDQRRQRLQIGGGALVVAVIWTVALWPSAGDDGSERQATSASRPDYTPWTRAAVGSGSAPTSERSSIPTVLASSIPTVGAAPAPDSRIDRGVGRAPTATSTPSTTTTTTTTTPPTSTATKPGKGSGKPPRPTDQSPTSTAGGLDLFDIFGL